MDLLSFCRNAFLLIMWKITTCTDEGKYRTMWIISKAVDSHINLAHFILWLICSSLSLQENIMPYFFYFDMISSYVLNATELNMGKHYEHHNSSNEMTKYKLQIDYILKILISTFTQLSKNSFPALNHWLPENLTRLTLGNRLSQFNDN